VYCSKVTNRNALRRWKTHFGQIPVDEVLKKVAQGEASKDTKAGQGNLIVERASQKTEPYSVRPESLVPGTDIERNGH
jgi:hypothetical protein